MPYQVPKTLNKTCRTSCRTAQKSRLVSSLPFRKKFSALVAKNSAKITSKFYRLEQFCLILFLEIVDLQKPFFS